MIFLTALPLLFTLSIAARAAEDEAGDVSVEQYLQQLSTVPDLFERKDPFAEVPPPFSVNAVETNQDDTGAPSLSAPPLERFPVVSYELVAILLGDQYPRALVRVPVDGGGQHVLIVKEGDRLGNQKGVIASIKIDGIHVRQSQKSSHGFSEKAEVVLRVGAKASVKKEGASGTAPPPTTK